MIFSFWFDTKLGIVHCTYLWVSDYNFKNKYLLFCLNLFTLTNSVDPDEMQHYAAFHLGLHSLQNDSFRSVLNTKGNVYISFYTDVVLNSGDTF